MNGSSDTIDEEQCAGLFCGKGLIILSACNKNVITVLGIKINEKTNIVHSEIQT